MAGPFSSFKLDHASGLQSTPNVGILGKAHADLAPPGVPRTASDSSHLSEVYTRGRLPPSGHTPQHGAPRLPPSVSYGSTFSDGYVGVLDAGGGDLSGSHSQSGLGFGDGPGQVPPPPSVPQMSTVYETMSDGRPSPQVGSFQAGSMPSFPSMPGMPVGPPQPQQEFVSTPFLSQGPMPSLPSMPSMPAMPDSQPMPQPPSPVGRLVGGGVGGGGSSMGGSMNLRIPSSQTSNGPGAWVSVPTSQGSMPPASSVASFPAAAAGQSIPKPASYAIPSQSSLGPTYSGVPASQGLAGTGAPPLQTVMLSSSQHLTTSGPPLSSVGLPGPAAPCQYSSAEVRSAVPAKPPQSEAPITHPRAYASSQAVPTMSQSGLVVPSDTMPQSMQFTPSGAYPMTSGQPTSMKIRAALSRGRA